ncbi:hypothetical protein MKW98_015230 [Papaver atlanticum]|uniref:Uncharacterized protein n=1 Tax=Papaver atlanticum TaxID=357466 RepID=A0AAD4T6M0_9MAGN|nr:hypothetical protein MKW98_015230 [Papaver atlanticum]
MASSDTLLNKETEQVKVDTVDHRTYPAGEHGEEKTTTENIQVVHEQVVPPQHDEHSKVDSATATPAHAATPGIFAGAAASIASTYQSAKDFAFSSTTNNTHNTDEDTLR